MLSTLIAVSSCAPPLRARPVQVTPDLAITVYEVNDPSHLVRDWSFGGNRQGAFCDPFGTVLWPGALFAARRLAARREDVAGRDVPRRDFTS